MRGDLHKAHLGVSTEYPDMDFETYSEAGHVWTPNAGRSKLGAWKGIRGHKNKGIEAVGTAAYAEHPTTEVLCLAYDLKDGLGPSLWTPYDEPPYRLFNYLDTGGPIESFHSLFEYFIWYFICMGRMGWPELKLDQTRDAAAKSRAFGLPGKLDTVSKVIGKRQKDARGEKLINLLCMPQNPTRVDPRIRRTPENDPELFAELYEYCVGDIAAEADVSSSIPDLNADEFELWQIDQRINVRGCKVDRQYLNHCIHIADKAVSKYQEEILNISGYRVTQLEKLKVWMKNQGFIAESLDEEHVSKYLSLNPPAPVRRVLEIRQLIGSSAIKKLYALDRQLSSDSRNRCMYMFSGATQTQRFSGVGAQPQNMPSGGPDIYKCNSCQKIYSRIHDNCPYCKSPDKNSDIEWCAEATELALEHIASRDLDFIENMWGNSIKAISGCIRGLFIADDGKELISSDFSAIEAVVLAALAGEEWRLDIFRTHKRIYEASAAKIWKTPLEEMIAYKKETGNHHPLRKKGKVAELASGYQGWVGAWLNFGADKYMDRDEIVEAILGWRAESPRIVEFWGGQYRQYEDQWGSYPELYGVEGAAIMAIQNPGQAFKFREVAYGVYKNILYCKLPSGRFLTYHNPFLVEVEDHFGRPSVQIGYYGRISKNKPWGIKSTYGGSLTENITQAVARDRFVYSMIKLERSGFPIVLHTHDEITCEIPLGTGDVKLFESIMEINPEWCKDWPISVSGGWVGKRYRK